MESKGTKFVTSASELCLVTVMLVPFFAGQLHVSGVNTGPVTAYGQQTPEYAISTDILLELNDPVPVR
ncbi:hypothetical protein C0Q44_03020 [Paenibacillus sp. PCH8]|uniref:hypothetical protein n=1 Tax=Paenibacillus sp. PCH8 TaxID=2066524 RepID=UPI000CF9A7B5|nr:hypothetical protein [Paenibacillus sp. PCH8]PQP83677.1 hypothetical protein C0Q44_03020 [Paenibacillus sp. PCH8]